MSWLRRKIVFALHFGGLPDDIFWGKGNRGQVFRVHSSVAIVHAVILLWEILVIGCGVESVDFQSGSDLADLRCFGGAVLVVESEHNVHRHGAESVIGVFIASFELQTLRLRGFDGDCAER